MDQAMIERLEASFNLVAPRAQELADRFYARLFSENPGVRPMFPTNMANQKEKLVAALVLVVKNLRTPEKLGEPLREMGARHVGYGTKPEHYPIVRDTLVGVLAELAGDRWNDTLDKDWRSAIDVVSQIMLEGHHAAATAQASA